MVFAEQRELLPGGLTKDLQEASWRCFSCGRCTSGCPTAEEMEFPPSKLVKLIALGQAARLSRTRTIWLCTSCQTCFSRCPFEINIPQIIDALRAHAYKNRLGREERASQLFHNKFLVSIRRFGRVHEASFMGEWKAFSGKWFSDLSLGLKMFRKGKLPLLPERVKGRKEVRGFFKALRRKWWSRSE